MRRVIVNSTPLIVLCKIGRLDILQRLYGEIAIPQAVFYEVTAKEDSACRQISEKDWIHVECISEGILYQQEIRTNGVGAGR